MDNNNDKSILLSKAADDIPNLFRRFNADTYRGNYELYCQEFAYSLIFGNLRAANIQAIMAMLGISVMPNIMLLAQMDSFHKLYPAYPDFSNYPNKCSIVQSIQSRLKKLGIEGVVSRFLGHHTIGIFIFIDSAPAMDSVSAVASDLIGYVYENTHESISIGVSDFCASHAQFPRAYSECKTALSFAFYNGRRSCEIYDRHKPMPGITKIDLTRVFFTQLVALLDKCDAAGCVAVSYDMVDRFRK